MRAVVTGSAGFIGSHLVELLLNEGFEVVGLDDMSTGQQENIDLFKDNPKYVFRKVDLSKPFDDSYFADTDFVFHLAGLADIIPSIKEPTRYYEANVTGTINVLEACRKHKVKKLIYTASSSCYGVGMMIKGLDKPITEDDDINPMYPYALTKYLGEELVRHWGSVYKIPYVSLRLFNVYGPRARSNNVYGAVFKVFLSQKLHGKPLTIIGDGKQTRSFVYVKDVCKAFLLAAKSNYWCNVINIGGGPETINKLADLIGGEDYPREYLPLRPGEPKFSHADITLAEKLLGWQPTTKFEDGVKVMIDNIDYFKDAPVWTKESIEEASKKWFQYLKK